MLCKRGGGATHEIRRAAAPHLRAAQICIKPFSKPDTPSKSYGRFASIWLHLDTVLSRSASSHFRNLIHLPKAMADLLPYGFIWIPFCPDLHQTIFEPSTPSTNYGRFASIWLHLVTFLSRSTSSHFRTQVHLPNAKRIWLDGRQATALFST